MEPALRCLLSALMPRHHVQVLDPGSILKKLPHCTPRLYACLHILHLVYNLEDRELVCFNRTGRRAKQDCERHAELQPFEEARVALKDRAGAGVSEQGTWELAAWISGEVFIGAGFLPPG